MCQELLQDSEVPGEINLHDQKIIDEIKTMYE